LQSEIRAIQSGNFYFESKRSDNDFEKGYFNRYFQLEGPCISISPDGIIKLGEWHNNELNGCLK
jgi:hypothetical protein